MIKKWNKENLLKCVDGSNTYKDILEKMGLKPNTSSYYKLKSYLYKYSIEFISLKYKKKNIWSKNKLEDVVNSSTSESECLYKVGLLRKGDNFKTFRKYIYLYGIDISHFKKNKNNGYKLPISDILVENSNYNRTCLKNRLYKEGLKKRKCELCGQGEEWNDMKISLIIDHINGISNDNRLKNLRIVCPNCNAGLDTHCGKNIKKEYKIEHEYKCECGNIKSKKSKLCNKCYKKSIRKVKRPSYKKLLEEVKDNGYCATGRKYKVSDNSIRKWIKEYEKKF